MADRQPIDRARRRFLARSGAVAAAGIASRIIAATNSTAAGNISRPHAVTIEGMQFHPQTLTIRQGERVEWVNKDLFPHTVTAGDGTFDSRDIAPNATWSFVPRRTGELAYGCRLHPTMKALLIVQGQRKEPTR